MKLFQATPVRQRFAVGWQGSGKNRFKRFRDRVNKLHQDYTRQLGPTLAQDRNPSSGTSYDPALKTTHQRVVERFGMHHAEGIGDFPSTGSSSSSSSSSSCSRSPSTAPSSRSATWEANAGESAAKTTGKDESTGSSTSSNPFRAALQQPKYRGELERFAVPGFGSIQVVHGDLFKYRKDGGRGPGPPNGRNCDARGHALSGLGAEENDDHVCDLLQDPDEEEAFGAPPCSRSSGGEAGLTTVRAQKSTTTTSWLVPMIANFLPARGFSLEVLERGGETFVKDAFQESRRILAVRNKTNELDQQAATLDIGDVVSVDASKEETRCPAYASLCDRVSFLVFPYFWQGSALDASQRLRFCVKQGLERAVHGIAEASSSPKSSSSPAPSAETAGGCKEYGDGNSSSAIERDGEPAAPPSVPIRRHTVIFQHLALGLYGYEPKNSARILLEESFEALLQLDAPAFRPNQIEAIKIVEQDLQTARVLAYELRQLKALHSPNLRPRTAHSFYQNLFRKLIALPDQPGQYLRQHRVTFQKKHGIIRNRRHHYLVNMRPLLWRAQKVNLPPPLLVESGSGLPCEKQLRARPHYEQGVTHCLFPKPKTGFHALRRSQTTNEWIGLNRQYRIRDDVHTSRVPGDGRSGRRWGRGRKG